MSSDDRIGVGYFAGVFYLEREAEYVRQVHDCYCMHLTINEAKDLIQRLSTAIEEYEPHAKQLPDGVAERSLRPNLIESPW